MDSVSVSRDDIGALTQALDAGLLPAGELLRSLVNAIQAVFDGGEESVTVSVDVTGSAAGHVRRRVHPGAGGGGARARTAAAARAARSRYTCGSSRSPADGPGCAPSWSRCRS